MMLGNNTRSEGGASLSKGHVNESHIFKSCEAGQNMLEGDRVGRLNVKEHFQRAAQRQLRGSNLLKIKLRFPEGASVCIFTVCSRHSLSMPIRSNCDLSLEGLEAQLFGELDWYFPHYPPS